MLQLKQRTEEEQRAEAARVQRETQLDGDIQAFLSALAGVTEADVAAVFAAAVTPLELASKQEV